MTRTPIAELADHVSERVTIRGWVNALRDQKRMQFAIVSESASSGSVSSTVCLTASRAGLTANVSQIASTRSTRDRKC